MLEQNLFEKVKFAKDYPFTFCRRNRIHTFPAHWHNFYELVIALYDGVVYEVEGERITMNEGDFLLIHPCELHALISNPDLDYSYMMMQFNNSLIMDLPDFKKRKYLFLNFRLLKAADYKMLAEQLHANVEEMCNLYENDTLNFKDFEICSVFYSMFTRLGRWIISQNLSENRNMHKKIHQSSSSSEMIGVCSFITQHCCENPTLDDAALYAGFSRYHFSRLFHDFTGTPYVEFLSRAKLHVAMQLLADPKLSITDIALQSGFGSISSFNRCFQRYHNTTPSLFRSQFLKEERF